MERTSSGCLSAEVRPMRLFKQALIYLIVTAGKKPENGNSRRLSRMP